MVTTTPNSRSARDLRARPVGLGLHAFALPLVIEAIEKVLPPKSIALVPKASQGPLLVTLATELCCVLVSILHEHLAYGRCLSDSEDAAAIRLGQQYLLAKRQRQTLFDEEGENLRNARAIERLVLAVAAGEIIDRGSGRDLSRSPDGGFLRWFAHPVCTRERRADYEACARKHARLRLAIQVVDSRLEQLQKSESAGSPQEETRASRFNIDFRSSYEALREGAAPILMQTDRVWWERWSNEIESATTQIFCNRPALGLLRDPHLSRLARLEESFRSSNLGGIWTYVLAEPGDVPSKCAEYLSKQKARYQILLDKWFPAERGQPERQEGLLAQTIRSGDDARSKTICREFADFQTNCSKGVASELLAGSPKGNLMWPAHLAGKGKNKGTPLSTERVKEFFTQLRKQDLIVEKWLVDQGGSSHPCSLAFLRSGQRQTQKSATGRKRSPRGATRSSGLAKNQLYYCLSRGFFQFTPILSTSCTPDDWRSWFEQAKHGTPAYWKRSDL